MPRLIVALLSLSLSLLFVACSKPESTAETEPQPAAAEPAAAEPATAESLRGPDVGAVGGIDPTVVDPGHYTAEFENDAVRVLRIEYAAGEESVMHYHPDSVAVFLTDALAQMSMGDGSTSEASVPAGTVVFNPAGEHQPKNIGDAPWEVLEIELKPRNAAQQQPGGPDPIVVDSDHYTVEFENDAVRALRINYGVGEQSVMHYHPDSVAVFLTDHLAQMTMPDGSTMDIEAAAGDAMFIPGGQHLPKNMSDSAIELVLIELK